jgi:hypothetical protein
MLLCESAVYLTSKQFYFNFWLQFVIHHNDLTKEEEGVLRSRKMDILAKADANKETCVALAGILGIAPSAVNTIVKSRKDIKKYYAQCGRLSDLSKCLKQPPFQELESLLAMWFKQARGSNAVISGTLPSQNALRIATRLGIEKF